MERKSQKQPKHDDPPDLVGKNTFSQNETTPLPLNLEYDPRVISSLEYLKNKDPERFIKLFSLPENSSNSNTELKISPPYSIIELNHRNDFPYNIMEPIVCNKRELIQEIYDAFYNNGLTSTSIENFKPHFLGGTSFARRIAFLENNNQLTFIFHYLMGKLILKYKHPYRIIALHFCNARGEDYDPNKLNKNHNKGITSNNLKESLKRYFSSAIRKVGV